MTNYLHVNPLEFHQAVPGGYFLDSSEKTFFSFLQSISIMNSYMTGWRRPLTTHQQIHKDKLFKESMH